MKIIQQRQIPLVVALLLICGTAFAYTTKQNQSTTYVGFQPGYANLHYNKQWLLQHVYNAFTVDSVNSSGFAGRLYLGYDFNQYFAIEAGYTFLPKVKFNNVNLPGQNFSFDQSIFNLCAKATMPLQYHIDIYGEAGGAMVVGDDAKVSYENQIIESDSVDKKTIPVIGAGVDYGFNDHVFADLSYMHYFGQDDLKPTDFIGIGAVYRF